jgi:2-polyprenyl-6-methoxyphenol hydroxylase-like FAD-dependent oxidoreductase
VRGPTGLVLAIWLTKLGARIRIIDKTAEPGTASRALMVQVRTLELYRQVGLADNVVARGHKVPAVQFSVKGEPQARLSFEEVGTDFYAGRRMPGGWETTRYSRRHRARDGVSHSFACHGASRKASRRSLLGRKRVRFPRS